MSDNKRDPHLNPVQWHHGYIGAVLQTAGLVTILAAPERHWLAVVGLLVGIAGTLLVIDDLIQHAIQHYRPGYRSPVNKLWGKILRMVGR